MNGVGTARKGIGDSTVDDASTAPDRTLPDAQRQANEWDLTIGARGGDSLSPNSVEDFSPLGQPLITLFVTKRAPVESRAAHTLLAALGREFLVQATDADQLAVDYLGQRFDGLLGVQFLADALAELDHALNVENEELRVETERHGHRAVRADAEALLDDRLLRSRQELERMLA